MVSNKWITLKLLNYDPAKVLCNIAETFLTNFIIVNRKVVEIIAFINRMMQVHVLRNNNNKKKKCCYMF